MFEGIGKAIGCLVVIALSTLLALLALVLYVIYDKTGTQTYESKVKIEPKIKYVTDGKKVDTVYVYVFNE
jgi:hypothetical protein